MIEFKKFKRFTRYKQSNKVNEPKMTAAATDTVGEQLATPCQTPEAQFSVAVHDDSVSAKVKMPFKLNLSAKDAEILQTDIHNSLEIVMRAYFKGKTGVPLPESEDDQELEAHPKPRKGYMRKATNAPQMTDKHQIATIISGDGTIGLSEALSYHDGEHRQAIHIPPEGYPGSKEVIHHVAHREAYDIPQGHHLEHSYTDTTMQFTKHYHAPRPIHTHHMDLVAND